MAWHGIEVEHNFPLLLHYFYTCFVLALDAIESDGRGAQMQRCAVSQEAERTSLHHVLFS